MSSSTAIVLNLSKGYPLNDHLLYSAEENQMGLEQLQGK